LFTESFIGVNVCTLTYYIILTTDDQTNIIVKLWIGTMEHNGTGQRKQ